MRKPRVGERWKYIHLDYELIVEILNDNYAVKVLQLVNGHKDPSRTSRYVGEVYFSEGLKQKNGYPHDAFIYLKGQDVYRVYAS